MVSSREVISALYGTWRLALRDRHAMVYFDRSLVGTFRSFWAAAICYPAFIALLLLHAARAPEAPASFASLTVETIGYVIGWAAYPLAALPFCRWLVPEERALGFIGAYNWSQVLQTFLFVPAAILGTVPGVSADFVATLGTIIYVALLVYEWFIAQIALEAGGLPAMALVLLDVVLGAFISQVTVAMGG